MSQLVHNTPIIILLLIITVISCTNNPAIDKKQSSVRINTTQQPPTTNNTSSGADTLIVDKQAAIFYQPNNSQIEKRKQEIGENDFYAGVEDYAYYLNAAHDFLDSTRLLLLDAKDKRFIKFINNNKSSQVVQLDTLPELWGIYFFKPAKQPKQIDMTMIDEEYKSYFK